VTALDLELERLSSRIDSLPRRAQVALFWASSRAHFESNNDWVDSRSPQVRVLQQAQEVARACSLDHISDPQVTELLEQLDSSLPENLVAQASWICVDAALRIIADPGFDPGMSIEYALEPAVGRTSEELFGYWQVGSDGNEDDELTAIMAHPRVRAAVEFCRWSLQQLEETSMPDNALLESIRTRAMDLAIP
jgi:hypothetical protein